MAVTMLLRHAELSQRQIAKKCGVSQSFARRIKKKLASEGVTDAARKGQCGRKHLVTSRGKRILKNLALN